MSFLALYIFELSTDTLKAPLNTLKDIAKIRLSLFSPKSIMICSDATDMAISESLCYQYIDWQQL